MFKKIINPTSSYGNISLSQPHKLHRTQAIELITKFLAQSNLITFIMSFFELALNAKVTKNQKQ